MSEPRESADAIEAAAARWLARHDAGPLTDDQAAAFEAWRAADPRRLGAYIRLEAISARLDRASALSGMPVRPAAPWRRWVPVGVGIAAAALLALWPAAGLLRHELAVQRYATDIGEQYRTALADGSLVELNTSTRVAVDLQPDLREVRMRKGEAVFEVAKDRARPFIVRTELADVRAVGTVFSVRTLDGLEVSVCEGVVEIQKDGKVLARVGAGETYRLRASGAAVQQAGQTDEIARALSWREGRLVFAGETLAEAVEEVNRYNRVKVEIADPKVAAIQVGGYFRATDPGAFARALERSFPIVASDKGSVIVLSTRAGAAG